MIRWIQDQALTFLQRRCCHPSEMVAIDILEGGGGVGVSYCNRCGGVRFSGSDDWRTPCPNLWREKRLGIYRRVSVNGGESL